MIHNFGGFPQTSYDTHYPAPGSLELAQYPVDLLAPAPVTPDKEAWGFDHGSWGVLIKMYPNMNIPMVQPSIDNTKPAAWHFEIGRKLAALRDEGTMLAASGSVAHDLRTACWHSENTSYPQAALFSDYVRADLTWQGPVEQHPLVNYLDHGGGSLSNPMPDHYLPLLYVLGAWDGKESIATPVDGIEMGSLSMLSVQAG